MTAPNRTILVTSALPYANGAPHLGHVVESLYADLWVRYQRLRSHDCLYVCATDAHGTPTMLKARQEGIAPEALVEHYAAIQRRDFADFDISYDNFHTTHSDENREVTYEIYRRLVAGGHIRRETIVQAYDEQAKMFLPDRYVRGTCPNSYSTGSVTGNLHFGGLMGRNAGIVSNSFWDTNTSGQGGSAGGTGKTSAEMMDFDTFSGAGWDIIAVANSSARNTDYMWNIVDGLTYPFLSWQPV